MADVLNRLLAGFAVAGAVALSGCGGVADEVQANLAANTPLTIVGLTGLPGYTAGTPQTYSLTVRDPDGVADVRATLDGGVLPIVVNGDIYSVTLPPNLPVGTHTLVFTGAGKAPDSTRELPWSEGLSVTVYESNTPLTIGAISGATAYTVGAVQSYSTNVVDPNGISSVTATANGLPLAVVRSGSQYSATLPADTKAGSIALVFTAIGLVPDGTQEAAKSVTQTITVHPSNTPLTIGAITGLAAYSVGVAQSYSLGPIDPDGLGAVSATLDGVDLPVNQTGSIFSVTVPASAAAGTHTVRFSATGKRPDGSSEDPSSVSRDITIYTGNTPLSIGPLSGPASYPAGQVQAYTSVIVDPNGINSVSASLNGQTLPVVPSGSNYVVTLPVNTPSGSHTLMLTAVGRNPDQSPEASQSVSLTFSVNPVNTPLSLSPIVGPSTIPFGSAVTYSVIAVDPEGVFGVTAALDGKALAPVQVIDTYSVTVPASTDVGDHLLVVSATGRQLDGSAEVTQSVSRVVTVSVFNTPTFVSNITESAGPSSTRPTTVFSITATDPDGLASVTATFDGVPFAVTRVGATYSIQMATSTAHPGPHTVVFTAIGLLPDGTAEPTRTVSLAIP
ncbi:MAG: hypothetical protein RLZ81_1314 [Pseudomonadota bacterium]